MSAHRNVPVGVRKQGQCTWCGKPVLHSGGQKAGEVNYRRTWHSDCADTWKLHQMRPEQIRHVIERDGEKCAQCGSKTTRWVSAIFGRQFSQIWDARTREGFPYTPLRRDSALDLDHKAPLWSVQHLPALDRRRFYGPDNLWLLCGPCHKAKTRQEAGDRARFKAERKSA